MSAWIYQNPKELAAAGPAARWSVGYYDPDGKRRCKVIGTKKQAEKFARKIEGELLNANYRPSLKKTWVEFRQEYEQRILAAMRPDQLGPPTATAMSRARFASRGLRNDAFASAISRPKSVASRAQPNS